MQAKSLTVFTAVNRRYEPFVAPYIASVVVHNRDTTVEVCVEDPALFRADNHRAMATLEEHFPGRALIRGGDFSRAKANSIRFIETPESVSEYVYIGDVDIIITEEIAPFHLNHMAETGLPYSNLKRPNKDALSGLHFSRWDALYPHAETPSSRINLDEGYLWDLVMARGLPAPPLDDPKPRPLHGFHLSLNCDPRIINGGWGGVRHRPAADAFATMRGSPFWQRLSPHFDKRFLRVLFALEVMLTARFPEIMEASPPSLGYSLRNDW